MNGGLCSWKFLRRKVQNDRELRLLVRHGFLRPINFRPKVSRATARDAGPVLRFFDRQPKNRHELVRTRAVVRCGCRARLAPIGARRPASNSTETRTKSEPSPLTRLRGLVLLQCLREVRGALPQFVKQPRVLDGDDCLVGESRYQLDLLPGKWVYLIAAQEKDTNRRSLAQERVAKSSMCLSSKGRTVIRLTRSVRSERRDLDRRTSFSHRKMMIEKNGYSRPLRGIVLLRLIRGGTRSGRQRHAGSSVTRSARRHQLRQAAGFARQVRAASPTRRAAPSPPSDRACRSLR
jgi:hypothetical protein